jgi:hypothetical protein
MPQAVISCEPQPDGAHDSHVSGTNIRHRMAVLTLFVAGVGLALILYQPWRRAPFRIADFSEFLPLLIHHKSFGAQLSGFIAYYASQGRFNVLLYVLEVSRWSAFGWNAAAWQISSFVEMCGVVAIVYALLYRITGNRVGAIAGSSLFIVATAATSGWIVVTVAEPLAMWPLYGGALLATGYQRSRRPRAISAIIALLMALTILTKEVLIVLVPFVVLLAWTCDGPGRFRPIRMSRRDQLLAGATIVGTAMALAPIVLIASHARGTAYSALYGDGSARFALTRFLAMTLPAYATYPPLLSFLLPGNVLFLVVLVTGWCTTQTRTGSKTGRLALFAAIIAVPIAGTIIYLPWPLFDLYYALPFLIGPAALLAVAVTSIVRHLPRWRWQTFCACALILAQAALFSGYTSSRLLALREVNGILVNAIGHRPVTDTIVVAAKGSQLLPWFGAGPTLSRYVAAAFPLRGMSPTRSVGCEGTGADSINARGTNVILISYSDDCGPLSHSSSIDRRVFRYVYWPELSIRYDSVRADIWQPDATVK